MNMQMSSSTMAMSGSSSMPMSSSMNDYFVASASATILFESWKTTTWAEMLGSCFAVAFLAMLYEGLKVGRQALAKEMAQPLIYPAAVPADQDALTDSSVVTDVCQCGDIGDGNSKGSSTKTLPISVTKTDEKECCRSRRHPIISWSHVLQTALYFIQLWIGLLLMLVFMSFNVYLCVAVTVGGAVGYYCFAWIPMGKTSSSSSSSQVAVDLGGVYCH